MPYCAEQMAGRHHTALWIFQAPLAKVKDSHGYGFSLRAKSSTHVLTANPMIGHFGGNADL
jgi:hypothetical protein